MNQQQIKLIELIINNAKEAFDIELSREKLMSDASYRKLVFSELGSLEHAGLNDAINRFQNDEVASLSTSEEHDTSKIKLLSLLAVTVFITAVSVSTWFYFNQQERAAPLTELPVTKQTVSPTPVTSPITTEKAKKAPQYTPLFAVHGSNTIGEKLAPALLSAYYTSLGATDVNWKKGTVSTERSMQFELDKKRLEIGLAAHGSSTAFKALNTQLAQVGMSSRKVKTNEVDLLKSQTGDLSKLGNEHIIALDGLAIIVNQNNPLKAITTETLAKIFAGEITNWAEVGGEHSRIAVLARDDNSGTYDTFKSLVLKKYGRKLSASASRFESSSELSERVSQQEGAIGFIGLNYIRHSKALAIADSSETKAIYPTRFTIATEDYPLARRLYLYTPTNSSSHIKDFANFAISDQGQAIVQQVGLISQAIRIEDINISALAPEKYNHYAKLAKRLSLNFRFNYATRDLDNKGKRDLQRLVNYVEKNPNRKLVLMGFSDSIGARDKNKLLSLSRAKSVEQELNARGINVYAVEGFGENMPLANNDNEVGRERNRRVEVWVL